jgi:hypothetical protein
VLGIVQIAQHSRPDKAAASSAGTDCVAKMRQAIEREKAAGRLTAEQAMIRRQQIKAECS